MVNIVGRRNKMWRTKNMQRATTKLDDGYWIKLTDWHWRRKYSWGLVVDFWPSTGKAKIETNFPEDGGQEVEYLNEAFQHVERLIKHDRVSGNYPSNQPYRGNEMNVYPFNEIIEAVQEKLKDPRNTAFQQFNCGKCGVKQTIGTPNKFYTHGICEECGHVTNLTVAGCNYMLTIRSNQDGLLDEEFDDETP